MSAIRRANPESKFWRDELDQISGERIRHPSVSSTVVDSLFGNYPYNGQEELRVEFEYLVDSPRGDDPKPLDMIFYYRTDSDLWILDPGRRDYLTSEVLRELKLKLGDDLKILPGISVSREGIWNFVESAKQVREVVVRHDHQSVSWDEIDDLTRSEVIDNKIIVRADLVFEYEGQNIDVIYTNDTLSVKSDLDEGFEYIIQKFEADALYLE